MTYLSGLQSVETGMILNTIDDLRSQNIGNILELPQIVVCGDQSSGKSSVLNAVSTLRFPWKDTLCTRFATEVIMRPGTPEDIKVSIVPGSDRSIGKQRALEGFRKINVSMDDIAHIIEEATGTMGIDPSDPRALRFSNDILRFEVTGPTQPSLTLVDLPGLFQAPSKDQTDEDTKLVRDLVLGYMKNKRSVILAVISAKSDFVLQSVTKYSREVDPQGLRTLGIITKPDKLDPQSESEKKFVELAENRLAYLHRGWHVLMNRDYTTRETTQDQRDEAERAFLSSGVWSRIPENNKGIFTLRSKLSGLLRDQILEELPSLIQDAKNEISRCKDKLSKLGMSRSTPEHRRLYLVRASQSFNGTMRSCINGLYDGQFFDNVSDEHERATRLRAVVQNSLLEFTKDMQVRGHAKHIVTRFDKKEEGTPDSHLIAQADFEDEVIDLMKRDRGRELIGMYNPLLIHELFNRQSKPWEAIVAEYRDAIWQAAKSTVDLVLQHVTDEVTRVRLQQYVVEPALGRLCSHLDETIKKLLRRQRERHPITYNNRLVQSIQEAKQTHAEGIFAEKYAQAVDTKGEVVSKTTLEWLLSQKINIGPTNLERFAASEAIQIMRAYYKIAKETMVDNFSNLAIEDCLISKLPDLLSPEVIVGLNDNEAERIAMETEAAATERAETEDRCLSAEAALLKLESIVQARPRVQDVVIAETNDSTFEVLGNGYSDEEDMGENSSNEEEKIVVKEEIKSNRRKFRESWVQNGSI